MVTNDWSGRVNPPTILGYSDIPTSLKREVLSASTAIKFTKGTLIADPADTQFLACLVSGVVKIYGTSESGKRIFIGNVECGGVCPLSINRLLDLPAAEVQRISETDIEALLIPKNYFQELMACSESFRNHILESSTSFSSGLIKLLHEISFFRLPQRVGSLLLNMHKKEQRLSLSFTHQKLADELGSTREVISRLLKVMEEAGCVKLSRGCIEISNIDLLRNFSSMGPQ